ncbi:MAG: hypothetical protein ACYCW6_31290 [Candidatus Xenobia bacterium]
MVVSPARPWTVVAHLDATSPRLAPVVLQDTVTLEAAAHGSVAVVADLHHQPGRRDIEAKAFTSGPHSKPLGTAGAPPPTGARRPACYSHPGSDYSNTRARRRCAL